MTEHDPSDDGVAATGDDTGARSGIRGTPMPVDLRRDRRARTGWLVLLLGPVTWFGHFMLVYVVAEAGCTGDGPGLRRFDPPVPVVTTFVATVVAVGVCVAGSVWAWRRWRRSVAELPAAGAATGGPSGEFDDDQRRGSLAFVGLLLSAFSVVAVLFTGAPALVLGPC